MRVLILAADFKPMLGGIAEYTHQIAEHLQVLGDEVLVLAGPYPGDVAFDVTCSYGVQRVLIDRRERSPLLKRILNLNSTVRSFRPDLIIANATKSEPFACRVISWLYGLPFAIVVYGQELNNFINLKELSLLARWKKHLIIAVALRRADLIIAISHFTCSLLQKLAIDKQRTAVIHPAVVPGALHLQLEKAKNEKVKLPIPSNRITLLTLSRLVERKGIDSVLRALPPVIQQLPDLIYIIAGDGPDKVRLERLVVDWELTDNVYFAGTVSEAEKVLYYEAADVFVMPNRTLTDGDVEGFGIVFLEANVFGKPVIAGHSGGAVDAVIHEVTGLLVPPEDPRQLSKAILTLLSNTSYAERLGRQGSKRVEEEFTWAKSTVYLRGQLTKLLNQ